MPTPNEVQTALDRDPSHRMVHHDKAIEEAAREWLEANPPCTNGDGTGEVHVVKEPDPST